MPQDIFNDAESNFKNAEQTMQAFWNLIAPPFKWIWNKLESALESVFNGDDETTKMQLKKLPF
jgi:hypothetical protein